MTLVVAAAPELAETEDEDAVDPEESCLIKGEKKVVVVTESQIMCACE